MNPQRMAFDICRCYVMDQQEFLTQNATNQILGWIRSRSLSHLCNINDGHALSCVHERRVLRQIPAFFKKNAAFSEPSKVDKAASENFFHAEQLCRTTTRTGLTRKWRKCCAKPKWPWKRHLVT